MSILYQHCISCNMPIRTGQPYVMKPSAEHSDCYIDRLEKENKLLRETNSKCLKERNK